MGSLDSTHPADETLVSYGLGKLDDTVAEELSQHLEHCAECRQRVATLSDDSFVGRLREAQAPPNPVPKPAKSSIGPKPGFPQSASVARSSAPRLISAASVPPELADHPRHEVIRELGRGGMGVVYLARDKVMGRLEVLKVLHRDRLAQPETVERFQQEIQSAANVHHPNIVTAFDTFPAGDLLVFVMEYAEGEDLQKLVRDRGPLPVFQACYFAWQAAQGLQHAHERNMIHRDIKPGNLILSRQDNKSAIKILDFGLARLGDWSAPTTDRPHDERLTQDGYVLGTPDYIAPEQILDPRNADTRADIYSLGCTLYHLLTGAPPFRGTVHEILQAHQSAQCMPLDKKRPEVPRELAAVVAKMIAKDPNQRFQTPAELCQALRPFLKRRRAAGPQRNIRPAHTPPSSAGRAALPATRFDLSSALALPRMGRWTLFRITWLFAAILLMFLVAWHGGLFLVKAKEQSERAQDFIANSDRPTEAPKSMPNIRTGGVRIDTSPSPDELARVGIPSSNPPKQPQTPTRKKAEPRDGIKPDTTGEDKTSDDGVVTLTGHSGAIHSVAVSPDGKWIASGSSDNTIKVWDASDGRELRTLNGHTGFVTSVAFGPKGRQIASGGDDRTVKAWDAATGQQTLNLEGHAGRVTGVAFSLDGKRIVSGSDDKTLKIWDADTGQQTLTLDWQACEVWCVAFSPDGKRIVSGGARVEQTPRGKRIVSGAADKTVTVWNAFSGRQALALDGHNGGAESVGFSPDGKRIVSAGFGDRSLKVWDADSGRQILTLTGHTGPVHSAAFSPDGKWIVSGSADNTVKLWDATSGRRTAALTGHTGDVRAVAFCQDGKRVVSGSDDATIKVWNAADVTSFTIQNMQVEILKPGRGEQEAKAGDFLTVNYLNTFPDGRKIDSTRDAGRRPLTFKLGSDPVLKGWHLGLVGIKFGEIRRLTIPPELAFAAEASSPPGIPKDATVISEIELLAIHESRATQGQ